MTHSKDIWIKTGYDFFATAGATGIKIELLSKKTGISKSSFYHHFADLEMFTEQLLKYHIEQSSVIASKEESAKNIDPELINILIEHKTDLLFNRQLRIDRQHKAYAATVKQSDKTIGNAFVMVWVKDLNLRLSPQQLAGIFELALENFYLQINSENLNRQWLSAYFANVKRIAQSFA
jgi:AcrR family transcriptional regulator